MKYCLITFRSVTPAQRGERLLRSKGIDCTLQRTPRWMEEQGCGYSLRVKVSQGQQCVDILTREEIPFRKLYLRKENGSIEEVTL